VLHPGSFRKATNDSNRTLAAHPGTPLGSTPRGSCLDGWRLTPERLIFVSFVSSLLFISTPWNYWGRWLSPAFTFFFIFFFYTFYGPVKRTRRSNDGRSGWVPCTAPDVWCDLAGQGRKCRENHITAPTAEQVGAHMQDAAASARGSTIFPLRLHSLFLPRKKKTFQGRRGCHASVA
jgi:hypothetical protein